MSLKKILASEGLIAGNTFDGEWTVGVFAKGPRAVQIALARNFLPGFGMRARGATFFLWPTPMSHAEALRMTERRGIQDMDRALKPYPGGGVKEYGPERWEKVKGKIVPLPSTEAVFSRLWESARGHLSGLRAAHPEAYEAVRTHLGNIRGTKSIGGREHPALVSTLLSEGRWGSSNQMGEALVQTGSLFGKPAVVVTAERDPTVFLGR